jgi:hypothetical protein
MPRTAREKSSTGIYHVMQRGINRQVLLLDEQYVGESGICDIDFALDMFSTDRTEAIKFEGMQSERVILKADRAADRN